MNPPPSQPWEVPPDFELLPESVSNFRRTRNGISLDWTLGLVKIPASRRPILWARPHGDRFDAGFMAYETDHHQTRHFDDTTEPFALRMAFAHLWDNDLFGRFFCLNAKGELRRHGEAAHEGILVASDGVAAWSLGAISPEVHDATVFCWNYRLMSAQFMALSARQVWEQIQAMLSKEKGEANFARQFALTNSEQRHKLLWHEGLITESEFKALLRDLVLSQDFWDKVPSNARLRVNFSSKRHVDFSFGGVIPSYKASLPLSSVNKLWDCFLIPNPNNINRYCVQSWRSLNEPHIELIIEVPTAHERLEAHLRWREWEGKMQEVE